MEFDVFKFGYRNSVILMITSYQDEVLNQMSRLVCSCNDLPRGSLRVVIAYHPFTVETMCLGMNT